MTITMRGHCQICKRRKRIRRDGLIRRHYPEEGFVDYDTRGPLCLGSDTLPLEMIKDAENNYHCNVGCTGCRDIIDYGI